MKEIPDLKACLVCNGPSVLPFKIEMFDLVYSEASLHHYDRPKEMIAEMWRILVPGGRMIMIDLNPEAIVSNLYSLFVKFKNRFGWASKIELSLYHSIHNALPEKKSPQNIY